MGRIQSSVGLVTGLPTQDTIDKLIAVSARSRDLLVSRNGDLKKQQIAVTELTALVIGVQLAANRLGDAKLFSSRTVSSSNDASLHATVTGTPAATGHQFTAIRQASSQQLLSNGVADATTPLGAGTLSFRFGGFVDEGINLAELNGGAGVQRGKIKITDRSGASAVVDLRFAQTVDDVLDAINSADGVNITASASGDAIKLTDNTGQSTANVQVQEVGAGSTAADLGLLAINSQTGQSETTGSDVLRLHGNLALGRLNDGNGIRIREHLADLAVTFRNGETANIDVTTNGQPKTLGELVAAINAADSRLTARISADGDHLEIVDNTAGAGTFSLASPTGGHLAEDLGLASSTSGDTLTSRQLQAGLKTTLLSSLGGGSGSGSGLGPLGALLLTNRNGDPTTTVDLSSATTLGDVVEQINTANAGVTASVNAARNGILLADTTGGTGHLIVANGNDGTSTATKLRLAVDAATLSVNSGSLDRQVVSENTRLATLNNGRGVSRGSFLITDSAGQSDAINLAVTPLDTFGDLIDAVNGLNIGVEASLNATGDGVQFVDTAGGSGTLGVRDVGNGKAAADLHLASNAVANVIDGRTTLQVAIDADDTLSDVVTKINDLGGGVLASVFNDGTGTNPLHLSLASQISGRAGRLQLDARQTSLSFQQISAGQDALVLVGSADSSGGGALAASTTNTFDNVVSGLTLTIGEVSSTTTVTVTVRTSSTSALSNLRLFVDQYNKLRDKLDALTAYDETTTEVGTLFGSNETLRIDSELSTLLSGAFRGVGSIRSLEAVGVKLRDNGKLDFDDTKFQTQFDADPAAVKQFFTTEKRGVSAKIKTLVDTLAGAGKSLLVNRSVALQRRIDINTERITAQNGRLERERERLTLQFNNLETIIAKLQSSQSSISQIAPITIANSSRK